jgi:diguanylate cyclase (GGDEF)-like protein
MQILVADNSEHTRSAILQLLEDEGLQPLSAETAAEALRIFREQPVSVVILDLVLVGMDGFELLKCLKKERPECEVIVMTSFPSLDSVVKAMHLGAFDYLVKTGDEFGNIGDTIDRAIAKVEQDKKTSTQLAKLNDEIGRLKDINENLNHTVRDQQTGLYTSTFFDEAFDSELNRATRHQRQFSIVLVQINPDVHIDGEQFQVRALESTLPNWSRTIQERLRKSDIVARYDDHTLSIILPETGKQGALLVAECLIQLCDEVTQAVLGEEIEIAELLQVGIASFPDDGDNVNKLFDLATRRSSDINSGSVH